MKKSRFFLLLFVLVFMLSACGERIPSQVAVSTLSESTPLPTPTASDITVNIATQKIHTNPDCRYIAASDSENLRLLPHTADNVNTLLSMNYTVCSSCQSSKE